MTQPALRLPLVAASLLAVAGCSTFEGFLDNRARERARTTAGDAAVPLAEPQSRNYFVLADPAQSVVGELQAVRVGEGDTFSDLAREYGLGYDELVDANPGIDPWLPAPGTPVLLPTQYVLPAAPRRGLVLNIAAKRLFFFPEGAADGPQAVLTYPIGIGRVGWETPLGTSEVIAKATDPTWYVPLSVREEHAAEGDPLPAVVPPGPDNPLGRHVLKLDLPGYLIHGTNQPYGVGMRVSHGCVRLYPENIEYLYDLVNIGEAVTIINEPYLLVQHGDDWYFEAHAPLADDAVAAEDRFDALLELRNGATERGFSDRDIASAKRIAAAASGAPTRLRRAPDEPLERALHVRNIVELDPDAPTLAEVREMIDEAVREGREEQTETRTQ